LRKAPERLEALGTPEGDSIPPNTLDELRRDLARIAVVKGADRGDRYAPIHPIARSSTGN
jgi:transposase